MTPSPVLPCQAAIRISRRDAGFTMVEMSIVILIIATVVGMTVVSGISSVNSTRLMATQKKMAAIDQALMQYRLAHDQLPCPSDLTQVQGGNTTHTAAYGAAGTCAQTSITGSSPWGVRTYASPNNSAVTAVAEGGIPTYDLGLPYDFMYDGWGNRFRYAVDVYMANNGTNTNTFTQTEIGANCSTITIQGDPLSNGASNYTRSNGGSNFNGATYVLVSHGPNGHGAFTKNGTILNAGSKNTSELDNCNCNSSGTQNGSYTPTYVQEQPYTYNTSNPLYNFDDIVTFKERWQLQAPWDKPGTSCPYLYVVDNGNNRVQIVDLNGNYFGQIKPSGTCSGNAGALSSPFGVFTDNTNHVWVVDSGNQRIVEYSITNSGTTTAIGHLGSTACAAGSWTNGAFQYPLQGAIDSNGNIWEIEYNNRVQEFNSSGVAINGIGCGYASGDANGCTTVGSLQGYLDGELNNPYGITVDGQNNIWVTDSSNNRVQEFNNSGTFLQAIPAYSTCTPFCSNSSGSCPVSGTSPGCTVACQACANNNTGNGEFYEPEGITTDAFNNIWVGDALNARVEILSDSGAFITVINGEGGNYNGGVIDTSGYRWASGNSQTIVKCHCTTALSSCSSFTCSTFGGSGTGNLQFNNPENFSIPPAR